MDEFERGAILLLTGAVAFMTCVMYWMRHHYRRR